MHADYAVLHVIDTQTSVRRRGARVGPRGHVPQRPGARILRRTAGHPVVLARRRWPEVLARLSGSGRGAYLRNRPDVEVVDCGDLAGGDDIDAP